MEQAGRRASSGRYGSQPPTPAAATRRFPTGMGLNNHYEAMNGLRQITRRNCVPHGAGVFAGLRGDGRAVIAEAGYGN